MSETNDTPNTQPKRVRRERRDEILQAATRLLGEYGFQGTTLALVAEAVGLTEPGVLHYFPSKVHLLMGVLEYRDRQETDRSAALIGSEMNSISELFNLLEEAYAQIEKIPGLIQLFTVLVGESIRHDHPSHDYFVERYRHGRDIYVQQFLNLNETRIRPGVDLDELASLIMAVQDGLQIQWLLDPEKVNLVATFQLFSRIVVEYLDRSSA
jgi:AcrR family transcriptional regulator